MSTDKTGWINKPSSDEGVKDAINDAIKVNNDLNTTSEDERNENLLQLVKIKETMLSSPKLLGFWGFLTHLHWVIGNEILGTFGLTLSLYLIHAFTGGFTPSGTEMRIIRALAYAMSLIAFFRIFRKGFMNIFYHLLYVSLDQMFGQLTLKYKGKTINALPYRFGLVGICFGVSLSSAILAIMAGEWIIGVVLGDAKPATEIGFFDYSNFFVEGFFMFMIMYIFIEDYISSHSAKLLLQQSEINKNERAIAASVGDIYPGEFIDKDGLPSKSFLHGKFHKQAILHDVGNNGVLFDLFAVKSVGLFITNYISFTFFNFNLLLAYCIWYKTSWTAVWIQVASHGIAYGIALCYAAYRAGFKQMVAKRFKSIVDSTGATLKEH